MLTHFRPYSKHTERSEPMYFGVLLIFTFVSLAISFSYFYMFSQREELFMKYWGFAWSAYSCSLLCLVVFFHTEFTLLLEVRKVIDMFNLLLLLFGVFAFMHAAIPTYWYRFSLYMLLLAGIFIFYQLDLLSYCLPISMFQVATTLAICYNVARYWHIPKLERIVVAVVFFLWGGTKAAFSILELFYASTFNLYMIEILLSNILNFCILAIYAQYAHHEVDLAGHLYQTVVENASDLIFYYQLTPYPSFTYVTPSAETLTGYAPGQFYENPHLYLYLVGKDDFPIVEDIFSGKIDSDEGQIVQIVKKDGTLFWGELKVTIIKDKNDQSIAVEGSLRDITAMKSAQLAQIQAKRSRDLLLSYISHELRTPITSIAGYLTALEEGVIDSEDDVREAMEIITTQTLLLKKLIDDLDQLSKLEMHQFSFSFMTYPVADIVQRLMREYDAIIRMADRHRTTVAYSKEEMDDRWIVADEARISQVFSNLLNNAIKYSGAEDSISVLFHIDEQKDAFLVSIANTGQGIAPEDLPHIFDRFYQADSRKKSGRGLGLAISSEIIKAHNGTIHAQSEEGKSTVFTFTIPLYNI